MSTSTTVFESSVSLLHRISSIVSSDRSLEEMLGEIVGLTVQATDCDACLVYLIDHEAREMVLRASQVPHAADLGELRIKMGEGVTGWVAEHRSVVALPANASADPRFKRFQALVEDTYEAFLSVPIVSGGESIGVINVHHRESHSHTQEETATLIFIGEQMGGAVAKARLMEEAANVRRQLEERKIVERAKGILQRKHNTTEEDAYFRLRNQSRRLRRPMRELAEAIILAEDLEQA
jgi:signal transduction protein with GAF and PtsI domain